jgi:hypothetical protein
MSTNISLEELFRHQKQLQNLFWLHQDRLLSLIDSKFLRLDCGGIGLGSILAKHEREILNENKVNGA